MNILYRSLWSSVRLPCVTFYVTAILVDFLPIDKITCDAYHGLFFFFIQLFFVYAICYIFIAYVFLFVGIDNIYTLLII